MQANALTQNESAATSARGSSFFTAMRIMPAHQRQAMYEIYHFCRAVDDIADEAGEAAVRLTQLQQWRDDLAALYAGNPTLAHAGLAVAVRDFGLRHEDFLAVIDGMEMDVRGPIQAPDMATLELYCDRVACAVGRLSVRVFGMNEADGLALAHHLGNALQLTNILRDIDEDAGIDRLYLPRELLVKHGIESSSPQTVVADARVGAVCNELAVVAQTHFNTADAIMRRGTRAQIRTPRVMAEAYHAIYAGLMARGFAAPRPRVKLNKAKLGLIVIRHLLF
ncbi:MAG: presqualene diphosphate synthase HpnD [Rickettsiales bacterium]